MDTDTMVTSDHISVTGAPTADQLVDTSVPMTSANSNIQTMTNSSQHGGSNEDMKKVLMELDNTGYFAEVSKQLIIDVLSLALSNKISITPHQTAADKH